MQAAGTAVSNMLGNKSKNGTGTQVKNGLVTPGVTPEVEDGRVDAEKARQAAQGTKVTQEEQEAARRVLGFIAAENQRQATGTNAEVVTNNPKDDQEMEEAGGGDNDDDYKPGAGDDDEDEDEINERARVMSCSSTNYREILGIEESYNTLKEERTAVLAACRNIGTLIHPDYSNNENAEVAFKKVMAAARNLGLAKKYIQEVEDWEAGEEFPEVEFTDEDLKPETRKPKEKKKTKPTNNTSGPGDQASNPSGPGDQTKQPNDAIKEIYKLVQPFLGLLFKDDADLKGLAALGSMNEKIKTQNQKDGVSPVDRFTIEIQDLTRRFSEAKPLYTRFLENELDKEAEEGLKNMRVDMAKSYPEMFIFNIPTPQNRQEEKESAEREAEAKRREEEAKKEEAKRKAEEEAKRGIITSTPPGKIKYPWTTHALPDGRVIIAGRQHSTRGKIGKESTLIVASDDGEDPTFIITTGTAIGLEEAGVYFGLPHIKLLAEKRSDGGKAKIWSWRDKERFGRLLWVAVGTKKNHTFGKGSTSAHAQCCALWDNEIDLCTRSEMNDAIEERFAKPWIQAYCERKGIIAPWDVKAENDIVPKGKKILAAQAWLAEEGLGNFATPPTAGYSTSGWTAVNSPSGNSQSGNSQIKLLQDQMANLERKFSNFQPSTTGSLESILAKLEVRLVSIETKVTKVDDANTKLAGYLTILSNKFDDLEKKVQL